MELPLEDGRDTTSLDKDKPAECTVFVKHIPIELEDKMLKTFFEEYAGGSVVEMKLNRSRAEAFVTLSTIEQAAKLVKELNGFKLINKTLLVEWVKNPKKRVWEKLQQMSDKILGPKHSDPLCPDLDFMKAPSPYLEYAYPPPTEDILNNIRNAIASVPKLYTQVLHLMNKMNLPPPFGSHLPVAVEPTVRKSGKKRRKPRIEEESSESEISSEEEEAPKPAFVPIPRKAQVITHAPDVAKPKAIQIQVSEGAVAPQPSAVEQNVTTTEMTLKEQQAPEALPAPTRNIIQLDQILANRMPMAELMELPLFKDNSFDAGTPSNKLFIKNLGKNVLKSDLEFIFGRYFETDEDMRKGLEVDIKGGRMKGVAFVTFPTVEQAKRAQSEVSGYVLHEKPLIILFGKAK
eukprot:TRINITY_DN8337_c0_g1_i1.p1 TRINITY_DN8337_c0_g1~~TRINITY_DN8337_c0_g1_i1.p1  ORF type:complete len:404 (-),score=104.73 TRINITY_DN8337_c0_g1_i1:699-1910(-)